MSEWPDPDEHWSPLTHEIVSGLVESLEAARDYIAKVAIIPDSGPSRDRWRDLLASIDAVLAKARP